MSRFESVIKEDSVCKEIHVRGLTCANCAAKIEKLVQQLENVEDVRINLVTQTMKIEVGEEGAGEIVDQVREIVLRLEPHVKVYEELSREEDVKEDGLRKEIFRMGGGAILFAFALLWDLPFPYHIGLFLLSYLIIGGEVLLRAGRNILHGQVFDENFLMVIATFGAFLIGEYPEGVAVMLFYEVGEMFQSLAVNRSRRSIKALLDIRPEYATIEQGGKLIQVRPEEVQPGDRIVVKPGERVPLDGYVVEGSSMMDTSALTGESVPRLAQVKDEVLAGFINLNGLLTLEVTKIFGESTVAKILDMVQNASSRKASTENFITRFARYYTPIVVFAALGIAVLPPLVVGGAFTDWLYRGLIFLVVSCPCALVISIPLGFFGGIGGASRRGILIKGGNYLEALNQVQAIVFDKTGTLTKGVFRVTEVIPVEGVEQDELLHLAAQAEAHSNHPIARSILEAYAGPIYLEKNVQYEEIVGQGVRTVYAGKSLLVGNGKLMQSQNLMVPDLNLVGTVVHIVQDGDYRGSIVISDEVKEDAREAIAELRKLGIREIVMLTGDQQAIAEKVADTLKIDRVYAELMPDEKVTRMEEMVKQGKFSGKVAFVGDGINDAPVLARADVGIAMGGLGSDAAIEAADIVLMTDEPSKMVEAIKIARKTRTIVIQNIIFALGVKGFVLLLGAFGIATMWEAVFADVGVALIAVLNAMRVMKVETR